MKKNGAQQTTRLPQRYSHSIGHVTASIVLSIASAHVAADVSTHHQNSELLVGAGVSYPMLASVSAGVLASLERTETRPYMPHHAVSALASVDAGIGGGMASAGMWFPFGRSGPGLVRAIAAKASIMRTWMVETGPERNQTYRGGVIECFDAAAGMGGKIGVGYFRNKGNDSTPRDSFIYFYLGVGY